MTQANIPRIHAQKNMIKLKNVISVILNKHFFYQFVYRPNIVFYLKWGMGNIKFLYPMLFCLIILTSIQKVYGEGGGRITST